MTIEDVLTRHAAAIAAGDLEGLLADYADDGVVMSPGRTARGISEISDLFTDLFRELIPPASTKLVGTWRATHGEYVFVVWEGESATRRFPIGTDTFVVRGEKIVFQTFVAHSEEK